MPRGLFGSEHSVTHYMTLDTFNWPPIQCGHPPVPGPTCPGTYIEQVDLRHAANEEDNFLIDPTLKPIRTREFTLGLDHELSPTLRGRRPLLAQALRPDHRGHRRARARHRRGLPHHQSGRAARRKRAARLRRLHHLPEPAEADAQLRRPRVPVREAVQRQLAAHQHVSLQPAVRQLLRPDQLGREQPQLTEREPVLRRPVPTRSIDRASRCSACCRPIARTCSRWKAPTICRGARASASTGWRRAARRCRREMREKGIPFYPFGRGDLGRTAMMTRTDLYLQHDFRLWGSHRINVGREHREPVRSGHRDAHLHDSRIATPST